MRREFRRLLLACAPFLEEAENKASYKCKNLNPQYHIEITMMAGELRRLAKAVKEGWKELEKKCP